jgi:uncharacterized protein (DUF305 family)
VLSVSCPVGRSASASALRVRGVEFHPASNARQLREEKPGKDFDARFRHLMVDSHEDAVSLFENTAKDSKDPDVKAFAAKMLPKLKQHEAAAKALPMIIEVPVSAPSAPVAP